MDVDYLARRILTQRRMMRSAQSPAAREVHRQLLMLYEARLAALQPVSAKPAWYRSLWRRARDVRQAWIRTTTQHGDRPTESDCLTSI
jgi:hypothetical protein